MTYGGDYGQQDQYPQQCSGQPWPPQYQQPQSWTPGQQGGPWQPQYDPRQHQQRMQGPPTGYGQVQPYAPPLAPRQGYPQYAPPQYPLPPVAPKSTAAGLILGLLPPCGIGCMYAGRAGIGVLLIGFWLLSIPLVFVFGIGFLTGFATWIASAVLGYTMTREWNAAHGIVSLPGRLQEAGPVMRSKMLPTFALACLALAACGTTSTTVAHQALTTLPAMVSPAPVVATTDPADCAIQVQSWLAETGWYTFPDTIQQGITLLATDAQSYISIFAPNISQPVGQEAATTELNILSNGPFGSMPSADAIPSCADSAGYWQDAMNQVNNATGTDEGTPQATSDMQQLLNDLKSLRTELGQTAPDSGFELPK